MAEPAQALPSPTLAKAQLIALIRAVSGVPAVWQTDARPLLGYQPMGVQAWILLNMGAWRELGTDEQRLVWNAAKNENDVFQVGQRSFTLKCQAFSVDTRIEAFDLLERIRVNLRTAPARALMTPTLGLRDFQPIQPMAGIPAQGGGSSRIVLRASLDIRMLGVVGFQPSDPNAGNVIATAPVPNPTIGTGTGKLIP